jgi:hypothetical protein
VRRDILRNKRNRKKDETDTQTEKKFKNTVASFMIKQTDTETEREFKNTVASFNDKTDTQTERMFSVSLTLTGDNFFT